MRIECAGYLFGYPASKKQDAPGEGYPNTDRGQFLQYFQRFGGSGLNPVTLSIKNCFR